MEGRLLESGRSLDHLRYRVFDKVNFVFLCQNFEKITDLVFDIAL